MEANWILKANRQYRLFYRLPYLVLFLLLAACVARLLFFFPQLQLLRVLLAPSVPLKTFSALEAVANGGPVYVFLFHSFTATWMHFPLQLGLLLGLILFLRYWLHQDYNAAITRSMLLFWLGQWGLILALSLSLSLILNMVLIILYFGLLSLYVQNLIKTQQILLYFLLALLGLQLGPVFLGLILVATLFFLRSIDFNKNVLSIAGLGIVLLSVPFHVFLIVQNSLTAWLEYGSAGWSALGAVFPLLLILTFLASSTFGFYLLPALADLWDARDEYSSKLLVAILGLVLGVLLFLPQQLLLAMLILVFVICLQLAKIWDEYFSNPYRLENYLALSYFAGAVLGIFFLILSGVCARAGWFYFAPEFFNWLMGILLVLLFTSLVPMLALYYFRNHPVGLRTQLLWQWVCLGILVLVFPYFVIQNVFDRFDYPLPPQADVVYKLSQYSTGQYLLYRRQWNSLDAAVRRVYQVQFESPQILLVKK